MLTSRQLRLDQITHSMAHSSEVRKKSGSKRVVRSSMETIDLPRNLPLRRHYTSFLFSRPTSDLFLQPPTIQSDLCVFLPSIWCSHAPGVFYMYFLSIHVLILLDQTVEAPMKRAAREEN